MTLQTAAKTGTTKAEKRANQSKKTSKKAIISFFAGAGFLDLGFEKAGFETAYVNEYYEPFLDAYKHSRKVLGIKKPEFGYSSDDIKVFSKPKGEAVLRGIVENAKAAYDVVGFIGGPPCPDFSVGGKNRGQHGENGVLSSVYVSIICKQLPDFFLFENVKGLWSTKRHREFYDGLKRKLQRSGYVLTDSLINSIEYGAPQDRNRIILIGFHKNYLERAGKGATLEFPWQIAKKNDRSVLREDWPETTPFKSGSMTKMPEGLREELTINYWFEKNGVKNHPNSQDFFKPRAALSRFKSIPEGDVHKKSFKRLHRWRYSPTAAYGNNEVHIHPSEPRRITVAEALAIQSLPSDYELPREMTLSDKFKAVGNGVPYLAAKGVADAIRHFLAT